LKLVFREMTNTEMTTEGKGFLGYVENISIDYDIQTYKFLLMLRGV